MESNFTWSTKDWDLLHEFVEGAGWELVFGLNIYITKDWQNAVWDSSNAEALVKYTMAKGYSLLAWELGNGIAFNDMSWQILVDVCIRYVHMCCIFLCIVDVIVYYV